MYKIAFNDGSSISVKNSTMDELIKVDGIGVIAFVAVLEKEVFTDLASVAAIFNDETKTSEIDVFAYDEVTNEDGTTETIGENKMGSYSNYTKMQRVVAEGDTIKVYMVPRETLSEKINRMTETVATLETSLSTSQSNVASLQSEVETLKASSAPVDVSAMSVDEYKAYVVAQSKANLEKWFEDNFVTSSVHGGVAKEYSITSEKQQLLTSMIVMAQAAGEGFQISWNARGEACEYDWTLAELVQLAGEIETVVRPKVSAQQTMEVNINACKTKAAIDKIVITF